MIFKKVIQKVFMKSEEISALIFMQLTVSDVFST